MFRMSLGGGLGAHQVVAGNAIMLRPEPNCTDDQQRGDVQRRQGGGGGVSARAVTDSRQSPGARAHCSALIYCYIGLVGNHHLLLIISQLTNELQA